MIYFGDYRFRIGQQFDTGSLGQGIVEGVRNGRLVIRLTGRLLNGKRKKKIPRCRYSPSQFQKHIARRRCSFNGCQLELFETIGGTSRTLLLCRSLRSLQEPVNRSSAPFSRGHLLLYCSAFLFSNVMDAIIPTPERIIITECLLWNGMNV